MMRKLFPFATFWLLLQLHALRLTSQTAYPEPMVNQSVVSPSPDAYAFQTYGNTPTALYEGLPGVTIPIYQVKCGSLALPIALTYNYNGLAPLQDAGWTGLGWNLNAGGVISRIIEGLVDSSQNSGYNYDQYNIADTLFTSYNYQGFLQHAYNNGLTYNHKSYDLAPDVFDCEFYAASGKFFRYNGKTYQLSFDKQLGVSWPAQSGAITVTTADGTAYIFGAQDTTTYNVYGGSAYTPASYFSAWHLTMVVSADKKDTITLSYAPYTWQQVTSGFLTSYTVSNGTQSDLGPDPTTFYVSPSIHSQVLQSIRCRKARVSFIADTTARVDVGGNYPRLAEIDIVDSLTGNVVKKNRFSYEYFGQSSSSVYARLKLKRFNSINTRLSGDSLTYTFKYINEYVSWPAKGTNGIDYWGFYNGQTSDATLLPAYNSGFYSPTPPSSSEIGAGDIRDPNFTYSSYGALDTIVYPAGGYSVFTYAQNNYYNNALSINSAGPGICLQSIADYTGSSSIPAVQKNYTYLLDNGTSSSGVMGNPPPYSIGTPFAVYDGTNNYSYTQYTAINNGMGGVGSDPLFYYQKVTETVTSGNETHRSDHYFSAFPDLFLDVRQTKQIDYVHTLGTTYYTPVTKTVTAYNTANDTLFIAAFPNISGENYNKNQHPPITYTYSYGFTYNNWYTYWVTPASQQTTRYDLNGNSLVNTVYYYFNTTTRNLATTSQDGSDGQTLVQKFKYPEDYTTGLTGNMVAARVLSPVLEKEVWMKRDASDSSLISGAVTIYDQTVFMPTSVYGIETTSPIATLNNQAQSGGLYSSILSDSRYVLKKQMQYDGNDNPSTVNQAADIPVSYLWDYRHAEPIAEVKNAAQADIAYTSFEADGQGNWSYTGTSNADATSPTGNSCYNIGQSSGSVTRSGLTSGTSYIVSYWIKNTSPLSIAGTVSGYPLQGKTINGWTYFEHKITGQTSVTVSGSGTQYIDELRLYPYAAQMTTYTYSPLVGKSSKCDADNRVTYYQYDGFGRLKVILDQDHNIIKTLQYHYNGETGE